MFVGVTCRSNFWNFLADTHIFNNIIVILAIDYNISE